MRAPVSAVVLTYNEADNIEACLRSVAGWCRELHVVDSGSSDATLDIARRYTDLVHHHPYVDHASQCEWVLHQLPLGCDWLLLLDADNVVSDRLKSQIDGIFEGEGPGPNMAGYYSIHRHVFRNRPIRGLKEWWLRLIRPDRTGIDHTELVDFRLILNGDAGYLDGEIIESNAKENDIDFWIDKHQKFSTRMAAEEVLRRAGRSHWSFRPRLFGTPDERMTWLKSRWYGMPLFLRPFVYFAYRYFVRMGFMDGLDGFVYHFLQAFWFRLLVDIKMDDIHRRIDAGELTLDELANRYAHNFATGVPT